MQQNSSEKMKERLNEKWAALIERLVKQGNILQLAAREDSYIDWLSTKYNLQNSLLIFGLRAVLDVLQNRDIL